MYLITNRNLCNEDRYFEVIKECMENRVENIIIREKDLDNNSLEILCKNIKGLRSKVNTEENNSDKYIITGDNLDDISKGIEIDSEISNINNKSCTNLIVNSNIRIYENGDVDGIHLPFNMFLDLIHQGYEFDKEKILGISIHTLDEIKILEQLKKHINVNISYIILSHIYETKCKENLRPKGIIFLNEAKKITDLKIVALGGILPQNVKNTLNYCDDIAVMSTIMKSKDVTKVINDYKV